MSVRELDEALKRVVSATADKAASLSFTRRGALLRVLSGGNAGVIEFQRSTASTKTRLVFTINLGIVCGRLLDPEQPALDKATSIDAHLRQRIGMLMPGQPDKWWEITETTDAETLAEEVSTLVSSEAVPFVRRYLDTSDLIALWRSGRSPGLTETQRVRNLERLARRDEQ